MEDSNRDTAYEDGEDDGGPLLARQYKSEIQVPEAPCCSALVVSRCPARATLLLRSWRKEQFPNAVWPCKVSLSQPTKKLLFMR